MTNIFWDFVVPAILLAAIAWLCVHISRPVFKQRWTKITSQALATLLLLIASIFTKATTSAGSSNIDDTESVVILISVILAIKFISMYLISCYAKSVGKSPYWAFIGVLNFYLALPILIFGLWRPKRQEKSAAGEMEQSVGALGTPLLLSDPAQEMGNEPRSKLQGNTTRSLDVTHLVRALLKVVATGPTDGGAGSPENQPKPITLHGAALAAAAIAFAFLLYAIATVQEYHEDGHFVLLRLTVSTSALIWAFDQYRTGRIYGLTIAALVVLIFNPLLPIEYLEDDDDSMPFMLGAAAFFGAMLFAEGWVSGWIKPKSLAIVGGVAIALAALPALLELNFDQGTEQTAGPTSAEVRNAEQGALKSAAAQRAEASVAAAISRAESSPVQMSRAMSIEPAGIVGTWVGVDDADVKKPFDPLEYCATDTGINFRNDGTFETYETKGIFRIEARGILLTNRHSVPDFEESGEPSQPLEPLTIEAERIGEWLILAGVPHGRCS